MNNDYMYMFQKIADQYASQGIQTGFGNTSSGTHTWVDAMSELMGQSVQKKSLIEENLLSLLEEANHPLTNQALDYIRQLQQTIQNHEQENYVLDTRISSLISENKKLKSKAFLHKR